MKKIAVVILSVYLSLVFLMPKANLWFTLEKFLKKDSLIVSNEKVLDFWAFLNVKNGDLYFEDLKVAKISDMKAFPYLFYNLVTLKDISSSKDIKNVIDFKIDNIKIQNSVIKPFMIFLKGKGNIGSFSGFVDLKNKILKVVLIPSKTFKNNRSILRFFRKTKEGFVYEYGFK
ncbi:MAG: hypothetical protein GXO31_03985 [Epsilonproteobacteria bacterium]|nr:hypothetical protein [Campylobacterota bacterium]